MLVNRDYFTKLKNEYAAEVNRIELEIFIHGAQCMGYSGRCLLSDYLTKGQCSIEFRTSILLK